MLAFLPRERQLQGQEGSEVGEGVENGEQQPGRAC